MEERNRIEAVLFTTGRFLGVDEISQLTGIGSAGFVLEKLLELKKEYEGKGGALEVIEQGDRWKLGIREGYLHLTEKLLTECELDGQTQKTLAVVAYKSPMYQSELIKIRGNGAYEHVKLLVELGFVVSEKYGRTRLLKVTQKFYDYFDVVEESLKQKMKDSSGSSAPEDGPSLGAVEADCAGVREPSDENQN